MIQMEVAVVGGGIAGLTFALAMHQRGLACRVFESAPQVRELGVGITLLPHAMREFCALGLEAKLRAIAIENQESVFFNRYGQFIYKEPRGKFGGYAYPELGIHRGKLHRVLFETALEALGPDRLRTDHQCTTVTQDYRGVSIGFRETSSGATLPSVRADVVIAADGINSVVRKQFYPDEDVVFTGINTWRGITRRRPILTGRSYMRVGSIETGKMVIYPIIDNVDGEGNQLINWMAECRMPNTPKNDWNKPGRLEDFIHIYEDWRFDWLDVAALIHNAEQILEYPMVDKDPVAQWTFGRVTFIGDAAHPMYPRGSNGAAQGAIDGRTLAECIARTPDKLPAALKAYEAIRLAPTAKVVRVNREFPPDFIIIKVDELSGGKPFGNIDDLISQDELRRMSDDYKRIAGFSLEALQPGRA
jgi:2-polyprenyl-6-methoxyphenol hydroxylase-like FAD-dependent oxidoreductase